MPIQYKGIIQEHLAVRQRVGLFDVSHMGRILVEGKEAESLLDFLSTNDIANKENGTAIYTVWCRENGTSIDDLIVYKVTPEKFFIIVNACNRQKDLKHLKNYAKEKNVTIVDRFNEDAILALQGPLAETVLQKIFPDVKNIRHMHFIALSYQVHNIIISRTGYTGEDGFEIYAPNEIALQLWKEFLESGQQQGIEPIGLGARDTLRLEQGYALYGHELSDNITPIESVSAWTVKWKKSDFLGKSALEKLKQSSNLLHEYGIILIDKGIAREGYEVLKNNQVIGKVTSGTFSPSLNQSIAIVIVEKKLQEGDSVEIRIRQHLCQAKVVSLPFL